MNSSGLGIAVLNLASGARDGQNKRCGKVWETIALAMYYIDDSIMYFPPDPGTTYTNVNSSTDTIGGRIANATAFNRTLTWINCGPPATRVCGSFTIPFTGSGITIYNVPLEFTFNVSFILDGSLPAINKTGDRACDWQTPSNCNSTPIYDMQSLTFGNHVLNISSFSYHNTTNSYDGTFFIDYAAVNDTNPSPIVPNSMPTQRPQNTAVFVGGIMGGLAIVFVLALVLVNRRRIFKRNLTGINSEPKSSQAPVLVDMPQPLNPMWSPANLLPSSADASGPFISDPSTQSRPVSIDAPLANLISKATPATSPTILEVNPAPTATPEASPLPRPSTADVQLTDEEVRFIRGLGSANVPATDVARIIEQMKADRVAVG